MKELETSVTESQGFQICHCKILISANLINILVVQLNGFARKNTNEVYCEIINDIQTNYNIILIILNSSKITVIPTFLIYS